MNASLNGQGHGTPRPTHLHHKSINDILLGVEPVLHLLLAHDWREVELLQVPGEELMHYWNVLFFHWSQSSCLGRLEGKQTTSDVLTGNASAPSQAPNTSHCPTSYPILHLSTQTLKTESSGTLGNPSLPRLIPTQAQVLPLWDLLALCLLVKAVASISHSHGLGHLPKKHNPPRPILFQTPQHRAQDLLTMPLFF